MMHREGWEGRKGNSGMAFAWFVWDRSHVGPTTIERISMGAVKPATYCDRSTVPATQVFTTAFATPRLEAGLSLAPITHRKGRDNAGEFMLLHKVSSTVVLGAGFTATLESTLDFMD